jgi:hypothetical protein
MENWSENIDKLIESEMKKVAQNIDDNVEANVIYRFFRWFQLHGEKHIDKSIETMIKIYLTEKK